MKEGRKEGRKRTMGRSMKEKIRGGRGGRGVKEGREGSYSHLCSMWLIEYALYTMLVYSILHASADVYDCNVYGGVVHPWPAVNGSYMCSSYESDCTTI